MFGRKKDFSFKITERGSAGSERAGADKAGSRKTPRRSVSLRTRIEAIALAAVTVVATASVDWAAIVGKAATSYVDTVELYEDSSNVLNGGGTLVQTFTSSASGSSTYASIDSCRMKVMVTEDTTYTVDVYQNFKGDYSTGAKNGGGSGNMDRGSIKKADCLDSEGNPIYTDLELWNEDIGIYLPAAQKGAIVINFTTSGSVYYATNDYEGTELLRSRSYYAGAGGASRNGSCMLLGGSDRAVGELDTSASFASITGAPDYIVMDREASASDADSLNDVALSPNLGRALKFEAKAAVGDGEADGLTVSNTGVLNATKDGAFRVIISADGVPEATVKVYVVSVKTNKTSTEYAGTTGTAAAAMGVKLSVTDSVLKYGEDYVVQYTKDGVPVSDPVDVGTYTAAVVGANSHLNETFGSVDFTITPKELKQTWFNSLNSSNVTITGAPDGTVTVDNVTGVIDADRSAALEYGKDFTASAVLKTAASSKVTYTVKFEGIGNYKAIATKDIECAATAASVDISSIVASVGLKTTGDVVIDPNAASPLTYNTAKQNAIPVLKDSSGTTISTLTADDYYYTYTDRSGKIVYKSDEPTSPDYAGAINAGDYTVTVYGKGNYKGQVTKTPVFTINPLALTPTNIKVVLSKSTVVDEGEATEIPSIASVTYIGDAEPHVSYAMTGDDYDFVAPTVPATGGANRTYNYHIIGKGNYTGEVDATNTGFYVSASLADADITLKVGGTSYPVTNHVSSYTTEYTGSEIRTQVVVRLGSSQLTENTDYALTWGNSTDATVNKSTFVTITGKGNYANQAPVKVYFTITPKALPSNVLNAAIATMTYTGKALVPGDFDNTSDSLTGAIRETAAKSTDSYYIDVTDNINAGTATVTATGIHNYAGTATTTFEIVPRAIAGASGDLASGFFLKLLQYDYGYTGSPIKPSLELKYGETVLVEGTDYEIGGNNRTNVGKATDNDGPTAAIIGKGNYTGTVEQKFTITSKSLYGLTWTLGYTGGSLNGEIDSANIDSGYVVEYGTSGFSNPGVTIYASDGRTQLAQSTDDGDTGDFVATPPADTATAGIKTIKIVGVNNYAGSHFNLKYRITKRNIAKAVFKTNPTAIDGKTYQTGDTFNYLEDTINSAPKNLNYDLGKDYIVDDDHDKDGDYYIIWQDAEGNPTAENAIPTAAGSYNYTVYGKGIYTGSKQGSFTIGASVEKAQVTVYRVSNIQGANTLPYIGENDPAVKVVVGSTTLTAPYQAGTFKTSAEDADNSAHYMIEFLGADGRTASHDAGTAVTVKITGNTDKGYYGTDESRTYTIVAADLSDPLITGRNSGEEPLRTFADGSTDKEAWDDAILKYPYTGQTYAPALEFTYTPKYNTTPDPGSFSPALQSVTVSQGTDFASNTASIGPAPTAASGTDIVLTGLNKNFTGTTTVKYAVTKASMNDATLTLSDLTYNGEDQTPTVRVSYGSTVLSEGSDYTVAYYANKVEDDVDKIDTTQPLTAGSGKLTNAKTYWVRITGNSDLYEGTQDKKFTIAQKDIANADVTVSTISDQDYTGSAITPAYTVSFNGNALVKGDDKDFTEAYTDAESKLTNVLPGMATLTLTGKGNFKGKKVITFRIVADLSDTTTFAAYRKADSDEALDASNDIFMESNGTLHWGTNSTGAAMRPADVAIKYTPTADGFAAQTAASGRAFNVSPASITKPGTYTLTLSGISPYYKGQQTYALKVTGDLSGVQIAPIVDQEYTGSEVKPKPQVTFNGTALTYGTDYNFVYVDGDEGSVAPLTPDVGKKTLKVEAGTADTLSGAVLPTESYNVLYNLSNAVMTLDTAAVNAVTYASEINSDAAQALVSSVKIKNTTLNAVTDYTVEATWGTAPSTAASGSLIIKINPVEGKSFGTQSKAKTVSKLDLSQGSITVTEPTEPTYNGSAFGTTDTDSENHIELTVMCNGEELSEGTDYTVSYTGKTTGGKPLNAGTYAIVLKGIGNYTGTLRKTDFVVAKKEILEGWLDVEEPVYYAGGEKVDPAVTITDPDRDVELRKGTDYTITYENDRGDSGIPTIRIGGGSSGNYQSTVEKTYVISDVNLADESIAVLSTAETEYTGADLKTAIAITVNNGSHTLVQGTDYSITIHNSAGSQEYTSIVSADTYSIRIDGMGDHYTGYREFDFTITPKDIGYATAEAAYDATSGTITIPAAGDNDDSRDDKFTVTFPGNLAYENRTTPAIDQVVVTDVSLEGSQSTAVLGINDITVTAENNTYAHSARNADGAAPYFLIEGKGNYQGYAKCFFSIGESIEGATVEVIDPRDGKYDYDGQSHVPDASGVKVTKNGQILNLTDDYSVAFPSTNTVDAGEKDIVVTGAGRFWQDSSVRGSYRIKGTYYRPSQILINFTNGTDYYYDDGNEIKPPVTVSITGVNTPVPYTVTYEDNIEAGEGEVTVTLTGNFEGERSADFTIHPVDISGFDLTFDDPDTDDNGFYWTGNAINPPFTITGRDGAGKTHTYSSRDSLVETLSVKKVSGSNVDPGLYTFNVTGKDNLSGALEGQTIAIYANLKEAKSLGKLTVTASEAPYNDGNETEPVTLEVKLGGNTLIRGTDYIATFDDNGGDWANGSTAAVNIEGIGEYVEGKVKKAATYRISDAISNFEITGVATEYIYTGGPIRPAGLKIMRGTTQLTEGTDYTLSFRNNIFPGTATMTVTPKPAGTPVEKTFRILKENINNCNIGDIAAVTYNGSAQKPEIDITFGGGSLYEGTDYTVSFSNNTNPGTATVTIEGIGNFTGIANRTFPIEVINMTGLKAKQSGSKTTLTWTKKPNVTGYRIIYGTDFKNKQKVTQSTTTYSFNRTVLGKGDRVGIQGYVTVGGETTYGTPLIVTVQ